MYMASGAAESGLKYYLQETFSTSFVFAFFGVSFIQRKANMALSNFRFLFYQRKEGTLFCLFLLL